MNERSRSARQRSDRSREDDAPSANKACTVADIIRSQSSPAAQQTRLDNVAKRLWAKFGSGDQPELRKSTFLRLERAVLQYGDPAYRVIQSCVRSAESAVHPDRYFLAAVCPRMREAGYLSQGDQGQF